ncbi:hypothetical protein BC936DRAFT_146697, partial [Jimgerdemannia flammicorona]
MTRHQLVMPLATHPAIQGGSHKRRFIKQISRIKRNKKKSSNDSEIILTDSSVSEGEESLAEKNVIFEESLLGNYNGQKTDPEIFLNETDEDSDVEYCEPSFNFSEWENWTLKSGSAVVELLKEAASAKGHWM